MKYVLVFARVLAQCVGARSVLARGRVLLPAFWDRLSEGCTEVEGLELLEDSITGKVKAAEGYFKEVSKWGTSLIEIIGHRSMARDMFKRAFEFPVRLMRTQLFAWL